MQYCDQKQKHLKKYFQMSDSNQKITSSFRKWSRKRQILICFTKRELKSNFVVLFLVFFAASFKHKPANLKISPLSVLVDWNIVKSKVDTYKVAHLFGTINLCKPSH